MVLSIIEKNRSYRRFFEESSISRTLLVDCIEAARLSPSGANLQPLKYFLSNSKERNRAIFSCLSWAGYLKDWDGPPKGERPSAYIIILGDTGIKESFGVDHGIAAQSILLTAVDKGFGGCILGAVYRKRLASLLEIKKEYEILLVIALGKPKERVVIETSREGQIEYYRDGEGTHYVPKRPLEELILD